MLMKQLIVGQIKKKKKKKKATDRGSNDKLQRKNKK